MNIEQIELQLAFIFQNAKLTILSGWENVTGIALSFPSADFNWKELLPFPAGVELNLSQDNSGSTIYLIAGERKEINRYYSMLWEGWVSKGIISQYGGFRKFMDSRISTEEHDAAYALVEEDLKKEYAAMYNRVYEHSISSSTVEGMSNNDMQLHAEMSQ